MFSEPIDYWLDYDPKATVLTLHFTLPFKQPVVAKELTIEIYDPEFFIDFGSPTRSGPSGRRAAAVRGQDEKPPRRQLSSSQNLNQSFIPSEANIGMGMDFADKILVQCP